MVVDSSEGGAPPGGGGPGRVQGTARMCGLLRPRAGLVSWDVPPARRGILLIGMPLLGVLACWVAGRDCAAGHGPRPARGCGS